MCICLLFLFCSITCTRVHGTDLRKYSAVGCVFSLIVYSVASGHLLGEDSAMLSLQFGAPIPTWGQSNGSGGSGPLT